MKSSRILILVLAVAFPTVRTAAQVVPVNKRGTVTAERKGFHDANNIRTVFYNFGMVGDYPADPIGVDLTTFHSVEVPKGSGVNYSDGITPFVLAKVKQYTGTNAYIMETGFRERQSKRRFSSLDARFEPRPGFFQADVTVNRGLSPAISNDPRTWPDTWPDRDLSWNGSWNGYFGKRPGADQESFVVMDDDFYDLWDYIPDRRDSSRHGLGLRIEVRGFQWSNPQAGNVIFWHYDITDEGTADYPESGQPENIIFGLYMDSGVGGSAISCDNVAESDDDNAFFDKSSGLNLVYTWDKFGHGRGLNSTCAPTGYLGYAYLETPGKPNDGVDNDDDGITDERRDGGPGQLLVGQGAIAAYVQSHYDITKFTASYGKLEDRPAFRAGRWWTGDEDMDWTAEYNDFGEDGVPNTHDAGEGDGIPTKGETNFDRTDVHESDQIGLTGFKMNRIRAGAGNPSTEVDGIVFFTDSQNWPNRLYDKFSSSVVAERFDPPLAANYNIGFLFASGPFTLRNTTTERFSLALAFGADLEELRTTVKVVQAIYNSNYQFAVPPPTPTVKAETGDGFVQLTWDDIAERQSDPVALVNDFEGYRVYRSTDPDFRDVKVILTGRGTGTIGNGKSLAQFDLKDGRRGFTVQNVEGISFYLGNESGLAHSFRDTTVTNGQLYYYAVTSYDYGPTISTGPSTEGFTYYPSESSISVSRTLRGGTILPKNVVAVRPNPKVLGYAPASVSSATRVAGTGAGTVGVKMVHSAIVPDNHTFKITFNGDPDSVHAITYNLIDSTTGKPIFESGNIFDGTDRGQVGAGVMPVIFTPALIDIDTSSAFAPGSPTNAKLEFKYAGAWPLNFKRIGFPDNLAIRFSDVVIDTSLASFPFDPVPVKFQVIAHTPKGDRKLPFRFFDIDGDQTLSHIAANHEEIQILTGPDSLPPTDRITWTVRLKNDDANTTTPTIGDSYNFKLLRPFAPGDVFVFTTKAEVIAADVAKRAFNGAPYVVPNPYVGAASFEPELFGVQGRGDRRMEFRNLPIGCTIRIYTVRGELVQTLFQDGTTEGMVPWNLRTKDNLDVAPGLYIFHVDAGDNGTHVGKFAIIK
jgi:hypothetical protein